MSKSSRYLAFFAYLLSAPGALYVLLARRDDPFAVFHARQSLAIVVAAVALPVLWGVVAWAGAWIPVAGPLVGLTLFALVIAAYIGLGVTWLVGLAFALKGTVRPLPVVGTWVTPRRNVAQLPAESEYVDVADLIERTGADV